MTGTIVNTAAVLLGSLLGILLHSRLPERMTKLAFQAIGLFTLYLGVSMAWKTNNLLVLIFALVTGAILGELTGIEKAVIRLGDWLKSVSRSSNARFTEGLVTAFLLWCMGSMTILGAMEEGIHGDPSLLYAKSILDGFASIALSSSMGIGVLFAAIPLFVYQGGLTLLSAIAGEFLTQMMIDEISAAGGILLLGLGFQLLDMKKIPILNLLLALPLAALYAWVSTLL